MEQYRMNHSSIEKWIQKLGEGREAKRSLWWPFFYRLHLPGGWHCIILTSPITTSSLAFWIFHWLHRFRMNKKHIVPGISTIYSIVSIVAKHSALKYFIFKILIELLFLQTKMHYFSYFPMFVMCHPVWFYSHGRQTILMTFQGSFVVKSLIDKQKKKVKTKVRWHLGSLLNFFSKIYT